MKFFLSELVKFINDIYLKKYLIYELVKRDFKSRYMGSYLGLVWSILQPLCMMLIMWFVFTFGLKTGRVSGDIPFVAYLFTAMIAWNFFSDSLSFSTNVIAEYSFLVKKINFRLSILPIVKLLTSLIIHVCFIGIVMVILMISGVSPTLYFFQLFYYIICIMFLALGLSWITSSLNVFVKDVNYIVAVLLQFGFWMTPIFWDINRLSPLLQKIVCLNPMVYVAFGYRDSLLYNKGFWETDLFLIAYFWGFTIVSLVVGMFVFKKLRPHFADVI